MSLDCPLEPIAITQEPALSVQSVFSAHHPGGPRPSGKFSGLWGALADGTVRIRHTTFTPTHAGFILERTEYRALHAPGERNLSILERVLLEADQKVVAAEYGLEVSTVTSALRQVLGFFGLSCLPSRVPPLLAMAAHASKHPERPFAAWQVELRGSESFFEVRARRPEWSLAGRASPAELAVVGLLMEGKTYADIARARSTSVRTVANQMAAIFRRHHVSGRTELVRWLIGATPSREPARA
jgi:DNA-binding CsgD family transcriptional regulator